ncbi:hypothetical protein OAU50_08130 [Planctomycetota bacterium]|nr:hypothetical protein [Planctomycetota bacterium]
MNIWANIRNVLIFAGLAGGGVFLFMSATSEIVDPNAVAQDTAGVEKDSPIILQTASPTRTDLIPLSKPLSLEASFGRMELTGVVEKHVSKNPLEALDFDRRWDVTLALEPPKPSSDLPPEKATDEVIEPEPEDVVEIDPEEFEDLSELPEDVQRAAQDAKNMLEAANTLLFDGLDMLRGMGSKRDEANQMLRDADDLFVKARERLMDAVMVAPNHPLLLSRMREIKAGLYSSRKHRTE